MFSSAEKSAKPWAELAGPILESPLAVNTGISHQPIELLAEGATSAAEGPGHQQQQQQGQRVVSQSGGNGWLDKTVQLLHLGCGPAPSVPPNLALFELLGEGCDAEHHRSRTCDLPLLANRLRLLLLPVSACGDELKSMESMAEALGLLHFVRDSS